MVKQIACGDYNRIITESNSWMVSVFRSMLTVMSSYTKCKHRLHLDTVSLTYMEVLCTLIDPLEARIYDALVCLVLQ